MLKLVETPFSKFTYRIFEFVKRILSAKGTMEHLVVFTVLCSCLAFDQLAINNGTIANATAIATYEDFSDLNALLAKISVVLATVGLGTVLIVDIGISAMH
jgi:hypothetical protein